jgi:hypothetical protein
MIKLVLALLLLLPFQGKTGLPCAYGEGDFYLEVCYTPYASRDQARIIITAPWSRIAPAEIAIVEGGDGPVQIYRAPRAEGPLTYQLNRILPPEHLHSQLYLDISIYSERVVAYADVYGVYMELQ